MALSRTVMFSRQNIHLLLYSQRIIRCPRKVLQITSQWKFQSNGCYSSSDSSLGYNAMLDQDLDAEHVTKCFPGNGSAIKSWQFDVKSSGRLKLSSPVPVHIESLDHQRFPEMNTIFMNMLFIGKDSLSGQQITNMTKSFVVNADLDEDCVNLDLNIDIKPDVKEIPKMQCHLQVPVKYDIDVTCKGKADASLKMLESETIKVCTEQGNCLLNHLKCNKVDVSTQGGDIKCQSVVQGNINMTTISDGSIRTGRLQGQTIHCQTEKGDIEVKAAYSETSRIKTTSGSLLLSNCHGSTEIESDTGHVSIDTMDGDLSASVREGDVSVFFPREGNHVISSESGNITLKLPSLNSNMELRGKQVDLGDVAIYGKEEMVEENLTKVKGSLIDSADCEASLTVSTNTGRIQLQSHSWLSSLNLMNSQD